MRLIDADKLLERMRKGMESGSNLNGTFDLYIEHAPTESTNTPINTPTDLISKAKVLETYSELYWFDSDCEVVSKAEVDKIYERLQSLPSSGPKTGRWIKDDLGTTICSECGRPRRDNRINHIKFCNSCGAKMVREDGEDE